MSDLHPVIAVTGSSGAGTSTVRTAFEHIFRRERVTPCVIEGDSFHRLTDINFQRVPTVDTSNPFVARDIPIPDESFIVIRFKDPTKFGIDFPCLLAMLHDSFMSRRNTIVVPGGKMGLAIEVILAPIVEEMMQCRRRRMKVA